MQKLPTRWFVNENCNVSGTGKSGKPYRKQKVLAHQGDEVLAFEFMLNDTEPYLTPGEYLIASDAVYVGDVSREYQGRTFVDKGLKVAPRFVPVPKSAK